MDLQQMARLAEAAGRGDYAAVAAAFSASPQVGSFGIRCEIDDPLRPRVYLDEAGHTHRGGVGSTAINGAVMAAMFDLAIGLLGVPFWTEGMAPTATLNIQYLRPAVADGVVVEAERGEVTKSRIFGRAALRPIGGEAIFAQCQGSLGRGRVLQPDRA